MENDDVELVIENLFGQQSTVHVAKNTTVRQLKERLQSLMRVSVDNQTLTQRRLNDQAVLDYVQMEDDKTMAECGITGGEQILLVPKVRASPPGYQLKSPAVGTKVLLDQPGGSVITALIDKALANRNITKDPNAVYLLVQSSDQSQTAYSIVEVQTDAPRTEAVGLGEPSVQQSSAQQSSTSETVAEPSTEVDQSQNTKTRTAMGKIRANIATRNKQKKDDRGANAWCYKCLSSRCKCKVANLHNEDPFPADRKRCSIS